MASNTRKKVRAIYGIIQTDSPYYGNLLNEDKWPRSRIIPYSLLYIATSV